MPTKSKHSNPRWLPSLWDILICRINCILKKRSDMEIVKKLNAEQEFDHMIAFGFLPVLTSCCTFAVFSQANFFSVRRAQKGERMCRVFWRPLKTTFWTGETILTKMLHCKYLVIHFGVHTPPFYDDCKKNILKTLKVCAAVWRSTDSGQISAGGIIILYTHCIYILLPTPFLSVYAFIITYPRLFSIPGGLRPITEPKFIRDLP